MNTPNPESVQKAWLPPQPTARTSQAQAAVNNKPFAKFKAGAVVATIWANAAHGVTGDITYHSISLDRRYQDAKGAWQSTSSLRVNDLPKAALVLQKAYEFLVLKDRGEAFEHSEAAAARSINASEEEVLVA